jgi:tetratricopeptide (TPR) repeat protein
MIENLPEKLQTVDTLINQGYYKNAIEDSLSILESLYKDVYKRILVSCSFKEKNHILQIEGKIGDGKSIDKLMIGQLISLFEKANLYKTYASKNNVKLAFFSTAIISAMNNIRRKCTHDEYSPSPDEAHFVNSTLRNILDELGYEVPTEQEEEPEVVLEDIKVPEPKKMFNNLPRSEVIQFIGRKGYIDEIMGLLDSRAYIISIDGIGGVGKSTLALEVAYKCWNENKYDAVIWVTAKTERLRIAGIEDIVPSITSYETLLDTILDTYGFEVEKKYNLKEKRKFVDENLKTVPTLLVVDNLETIDDPNVFSFLKDLPDPSKALITSRKRLGEVERIIELKEFSFEEAKEFLEVEFGHRNYTIQNAEETYEKLYELTGGIPLALKLFAGWMVEEGSTISDLSDKVREDSDILKFCFDHCFYNLMDNDARKAFCVFPVLPDESTREQIKVASGLSEERVNRAINKLKTLSLVVEDEREIEKDISETFYSMLPLTKAYAHNKLTKDRGLEKDARRALAKYFELHEKSQEALKQYGLALEDLGGQSEKGRTSAMLANAAFATYQRGNYHKAVKLFEQAIKTDTRLSYSYQLWATVERQQGNNTKAEELFREAANRNKKNSIIWASWAMMKKDVGDLVGARMILEEGLKNGARDPIIFQQLSVLESRMGHFQDALDTVADQLNKNPKNARQRRMNTSILTGLSETCFKWSEDLKKRGDLNSAKEKLEQGLDFIDRNRGIAFQNDWRLIKNEKKLLRGLGLLKRRERMNEDAEEYLLKAKYERPENRYQIKHNLIVDLDRALNFKFWGKLEKMSSIAKENIEKHNDTRFVA